LGKGDDSTIGGNTLTNALQLGTGCRIHRKVARHGPLLPQRPANARASKEHNFMSDELLKDLDKRMSGAVENFKTELQGLRTGRASADLLAPVMVEAYGSSVPVNQVGAISVPEPRMISVSVWDKSMAGAVERAIRDAGLGLNPMADGNLIRVPIPDLNEERRKELSKVAGNYAESARVAVRNVRRDGMDKSKKLEADGDVSKDAMHDLNGEIQKVTDRHIGTIDTMLNEKQTEIMQV
jgi:ribosome recycling factor